MSVLLSMIDPFKIIRNWLYVFLVAFVTVTVTVIEGLFPTWVFYASLVMTGVAVISVVYELLTEAGALVRYAQHENGRADEERRKLEAFQAGILDYVGGINNPLPDYAHYFGWDFARKLFESRTQEAEELFLQRCIDSGKFPTREHYLEWCKREAQKIRTRLKPYARLVRGPDIEWMNGTPPHERKGYPMGIVVLVRAPEGHARAGRLEVGASFCNPAELHKFDRHEAFMKAIERSVIVPTGFDPTADIEDEMEFYGNFPKSCRPMVQTMLNDNMHNRVNHGSSTKPPKPRARS